MLISYPLRFFKNASLRYCKKPSAPFLINYSVTFRCNLNCKYCGVSCIPNNFADDELTPQDISGLFNDRMLRKLKVIVITGGEPFLKEDLEEVLLAFQKNVTPFMFHITTNGYLSQRIVECVKRLKSQGVNIGIKISIDDIADKHDILRGKQGSFSRAVESIQQLRSLFDQKQLHIGINQTIFEDNYVSIPEVKKLAESFNAEYLGFIGLKKRPLYTQDSDADYNLVDLSEAAKEYIQRNIACNYDWRSCFNRPMKFIDEMVIRHYIDGQLKRLRGGPIVKHKCMCLFSHFRMNPNGDIITCSYDLDVLGNVKEERYSSILSKETARQKLDKVIECGKCWLGCEVSPSWVTSFFGV